MRIMSKGTFSIGTLVEHSMHPGYRGIICEIIKVRGQEEKPRVVSVSWFPPTSEAFRLNSWTAHNVTGTTQTSVLNLICVSPAQ